MCPTGVGQAAYFASKNTFQISSFSTVETIIAGGPTGGSAGSPLPGCYLEGNSLGLNNAFRITVVGDASSSNASTVTFNLRSGAGAISGSTVIGSVALTAPTGGASFFKIVIETRQSVIGSSASLAYAYLTLINPTAGSGLSSTATSMTAFSSFNQFNSTNGLYYYLSAVSSNANTTLRIDQAIFEII